MTPRNRSALEQSARGVSAARRVEQARVSEPSTVPGVEPKHEVGHRVSWHRHGLSRGVGVIHDVKVQGNQVLHMVRDRHNNVHAFPEHKLTRLES